ncbi:50S ribosomal protein L13 [Pseudomonadota bacterium]
MKTFSTTPQNIKRNWHLIDAKDQILGRLSTNIASHLIGKNKIYFTSNLDCGDYVVVINAKNLKVTGNKLHNKKYYRHSGYPGGFKSERLKSLLAKSPLKVIEHSVKGMLPKNKLRNKRLRRLKIYSDTNHPYQDKFKEN